MCDEYVNQLRELGAAVVRITRVVPALTHVRARVRSLISIRCWRAFVQFAY
jgi:hypothetical protein